MVIVNTKMKREPSSSDISGDIQHSEDDVEPTEYRYGIIQESDSQYSTIISEENHCLTDDTTEDELYEGDNVLEGTCHDDEEELDSADDSAGSLVEFVVNDNCVEYSKKRNRSESTIIKRTKREKRAQELQELQDDANNFIKSGTY
jgi:hypothetical protein